MRSAAVDARNAADVEILQHYGAEGSNPLESLGAEFCEGRSDITVTNRSKPITSVRLVVKSRMLGENPPDLWVEWPGKNLAPTVAAGVAADVTDVWETNGLAANAVDGAREAARFDGRYRCVPLDLYHVNNLFYNVELVERAGVAVEDVTGVDGFLDVLAALDDALDVPAIVFNGRDPFGPLQLWETFLLATGGRSAYEGILDGRAENHREAIERAVAALDRTLAVAPDDVAFVSSEAADDRFVEGRGALTHNGGWAVGRFSSASGFDHGTEWAYTPFPGTDGCYQMNMNAIVPAAHVEGVEPVEAFLAHLTTPASLREVTAHLGAVPPRTDVAIEGLHPVTRRHAGALEETGYHAPSITHGLGVSPDVLIALKTAVAGFMGDRDRSAFTAAVIDAL